MTGSGPLRAVNVATIEAGDDTWCSLTDEQRGELHALTQQYLPGYRVYAATFDVIDAPLLRLEYLVCDEDRCAQLKPGTDEVWIEARDVLLRGPLPEWWKPCTGGDR